MTPILGAFAVQAGLNPLYLILGAVMKSSFAFMLPVATPPNAIIFSFGFIKVQTYDVLSGFVLTTNE